MSIFDLERTGDASELDRLVRRSESPAVRSRAAEALGDLGEDDASRTLTEAAIDDPDERVRAAAVDALGSIGGDALDRLIARASDQDVDPTDGLPATALIDALEHARPELRMAAANATGRDGAVEAVPALVSRFEDEEPRVRLRAARAAGRIADGRAAEPLEALSNDPRPRVRRTVAIALGEIGSERSLDALADLSVDDDVDVRVAAVRGLGRLPTPRSIRPLTDRFGDDAERVRRATVFAIVDSLSTAPPDRSHAVRTTVVDALSSARGDVATTALVELLGESTSTRQRRNAAWLLGRVSDGGSATIETLVDALSDDDEAVRRYAATGLVEIGSPAVEDALLAALDTTAGEGRSMILYVLGTVGTEASRRRLIQLIDDVEAVAAQEQALAALSRLGGW